MYLSAGSSADVTITLVGSPTSVSFKIIGHTGTEIGAETLTPAPGATELVLTVPANLNTVANVPGWERRTVRYSYEVGSRTLTGSRSYRIADGVLIDADADLVRGLLGVDATELPDEAIDLTTAFFAFRARTDAATMDAALLGFDERPLIIARAVAALAALDHVDSMAMRVALKETSGSNSYERGKVDWAGIRATLQGIVDAGFTVLVDGTVYMPTLFDVGTRTDVFTS